MTMTEQTTTTVTKDDLAALRHIAGLGYLHSSLVAFYRHDADVPSYLRLTIDVDTADENADRRIVKITRSGLWTRDYVSDHTIVYERRIPCPNVGMTCYAKPWPEARPTSGTGHVSGRAIRDTIVNLVRVGDALGLTWVQGNNTDYLRNAGLNHDTVALTISRGGKRFAEFEIDDSVTPYNTASMVRFG